MRLFVAIPILSAMLWSASADAKIATINFSGSGVVHSANGIFLGNVGDVVPISGVLSFSDGSDPTGDIELPSDYSGTVFFSRQSICGSGENIFRFSYESSCGGTVIDAYGSVDLYKGMLRKFALSYYYGPGGASIDPYRLYYFDDRGNRGFGSSETVRYRLTSPAIAPIPEPSLWAMMLAGFGLAGSTLRRRRHRVSAI